MARRAQEEKNRPLAIDQNGFGCSLDKAAFCLLQPFVALQGTLQLCCGYVKASIDYEFV